MADAGAGTWGEAEAGAGRPAGRFGLPEVYAVIALLSFLVARFVPVLGIHYECPFRAVTGFPCATCGMTHAFVLLAHGHVAQALRWSPLGAVLAAAAWAFAAADLVRAAAGWPLPALPERLIRPALLLGFAALFVNWGWLVVHGLG
jgi:hypothetical protein